MQQKSAQTDTCTKKKWGVTFHDAGFITVFLFIFSLFLFTFFSIIEGRAVVIQPPQ